jgi:hypothetical protein
MALSFDYLNKIVSVPQSDCTLVTGTVYSLDTNWFKNEINKELSDETHIWVDDIYAHNTTYTIAGVVYARSISIINGWMVRFTPDAQWSVILEGSNNDIWDVAGGILFQNQVQVIPTNSAGLIQVSTGGGTTAAEIWQHILTSGQEAQAELIKARLNAGNAFAVSASQD